MNHPTILTLDLSFREKAHAIASYLIPWGDRAILIESGPASTLSSLERELAVHGFSLDSVSDLFVTHIHLDHAGAAGWLGRRGARVFVHPVGAPHLVNPEALLTSAQRIYGEAMDTLWGQVVPLDASNVRVIEDRETVQIGPHAIQAIATPGHASHHHVYLYEGVCFTGDIGGVRVPGNPNLTLPMPPPEFNLEIWRSSVNRLRSLGISAIAPTHFGIYSDVGWHLDRIERYLDEVDRLLVSLGDLAKHADELREHYTRWFFQEKQAHGLADDQLQLVEIINPATMSADGLARYWRKHRSNAGDGREAPA